MDIKELMVGDLVHHQGTYIRVYCIEYVSNEETGFYNAVHGITLNGHEPICIHPSFLKPLSLTETLLKLNGWELLDSNDKDVFWKEDSTNFIVSSWCDFFYRDEIPIRYVHEFQHILRLCGYANLADTFKVFIK